MSKSILPFRESSVFWGICQLTFTSLLLRREGGYNGGGYTVDREDRRHETKGSTPSEDNLLWKMDFFFGRNSMRCETTGRG